MRGLSGRSDLASLARDVIMRGGLDPGYLMEVEQLLLYLKNRQLARPAQEGAPAIVLMFLTCHFIYI